MRLQQTISISSHEQEEKTQTIEEDVRKLKDSFKTLYTTNEYKATLTGHSNQVYCLVELKDGRLASGSYDKTIKLWDTATNECKATLIGHSSVVRCLVELSDGRLASVSQDNTIKLWDTTTNECKATLTGHSYHVYCLVELSDGRLASGSISR